MIMHAHFSPHIHSSHVRAQVLRLEKDQVATAAAHLERETKLVSAVELQERLSSALKANSSKLAVQSTDARSLATAMQQVRNGSCCERGLEGEILIGGYSLHLHIVSHTPLFLLLLLLLLGVLSACGRLSRAAQCRGGRTG